MTLRRANEIAGGLFGYAFASLASFFLLLFNWNRLAPSVSDPVNGSVVAHNEHGTITYFTAFQATSCALLFFSAGVAFVLCMIIGPKKNMRVTKLGEVPLGWHWEHDDPDNARKKGLRLGAAAALVITFVVGPYL